MPGTEEYLDSEKYEIRVRDWSAPGQHHRTTSPGSTRSGARTRRSTPWPEPPLLPGGQPARALLRQAHPGARQRRSWSRSTWTRSRPTRPRCSIPLADDRDRARTRPTSSTSSWAATRRSCRGADPHGHARPARRARARSTAWAAGAAASATSTTTREPRIHDHEQRPALVQGRGLLRAARARVQGRQRRRHRRLHRAHQQLDYLKELGVDCLWLLPFFPSPLRDDGYDVADYRAIHPDYGTMADFERFLEAAHGRGLRVISDLVVNHTSDQHPWFQAARRSPDSPYRDYYVWSDTDQRYRDARIIFLDTESSNWTWDPVAKAYYWHRFFSHQPDLNFDNPARPPRDARRRCASGSTRASTASAATPCPTSSSARAPTARTCPRPTPSCRRSAPAIDARLPGAHPPGRGQPVAAPTSAPTSATATSSTWPSTSR